MPLSREFRLASRPKGMPTPANFEFLTVDIGEPADGQILVRNLVLSVDPYMRARMNDAKSYVPPFQVGATLEGGAVGRVVASRAAGFAPGDLVLSMFGWREYFVADTKTVKKLDPAVEPISAWLGVLGVTGLTAWAGLDLLRLEAGDRLFVSGAAGAVGMIAGQLARIRGCTVIGSAGSAEKVRLLTEELGFHAAFNYRDGDVYRQLMAAAPQGIDGYFDNVGGDHLEAAISAMRPHGRIAACGSISGYNEPTPGPRNMPLIIGKRLTIQGFIVIDHAAQTAAFEAEIIPLLANGSVKALETTVRGIEHTATAFLSLFTGANTGKMLVALD